MDSPPTLHYAPAPPPAARRRRRGIRLILLGGFIAILWFWGGAAWIRLNSLYWEHRCLTYTQPPEHVVFQSANGVVTVFDSPRPLSYLNRYRDQFAIDRSCTIFLHEMRRPDGTRMLVWLGLWAPIDGPANSYILLDDRAILNSMGPSHLDEISNGDSLPLNVYDTDRWKIFAGQVDPMNPSHLTFDFDHNGQRHTADAWLDNAGKLLVSVRP